MELEFKKVGSRYEAEFEATGNFNLNIERVAPEKIQVFQKGAEDGEYASQASWYNNYASAIVDYDFSALIYPKWIKVVSYSEPVQAIVTMEGESGGSGSGSGGGLRPVIAEDFSSIVLSNSDVGSIDETFSDTITLTGQTTINLKLNNKNAYLVQSVKEDCQLVYSGEDQDIYYYRNGSYAPTTFNMSQLYIKED